MIWPERIILAALSFASIVTNAADATITVTDDNGRIVVEHAPPKGLVFGRLSAGERKTMPLAIINKTGREVEVDGWRSPCACLEFGGVIESIPKGTSESVLLFLDGSSFRGGVSKYIHLSFNADKSEGTNHFLPVSFFVGDMATAEGLDPERSIDASTAYQAGATQTAQFSTVAQSETTSTSGVTEIVYEKSMGRMELAKVEAWIFAGKNCPGCNYLKTALLPSLFESQPAKVAMADLDKKENLLLLLKLEEKLGVDGRNSKTPVLYWRNNLFYGNEAVKAMIENPALRPEPVKDALDQSFVSDTTGGSEGDIAGAELRK